MGRIKVTRGYCSKDKQRLSGQAKLEVPESCTKISLAEPAYNVSPVNVDIKNFSRLITGQKPSFLLQWSAKTTSEPPFTVGVNVVCDDGSNKVVNFDFKQTGCNVIIA